MLNVVRRTLLIADVIYISYRNRKETDMDKVVNDIMNGIAKIYDTYEDKANQRSE